MSVYWETREDNICNTNYQFKGVRYPFKFRFAFRSSAERFKEYMQEKIAENGCLSVHDIYDVFNVATPLNARSYGWRSLSATRAMEYHGNDGEVIIRLSPAQKLVPLSQFYEKSRRNDTPKAGQTPVKPGDIFIKGGQPNMLNGLRITDVQLLNDRVVIMRFSDGTFTKATCTKDDAEAGKFDPDIGITICMMKKLLGEADGTPKAYKKFLKQVHNGMDMRRKAAEEKAQKEANREKRAIRKAKRRLEEAKAEEDNYKALITSAVKDALPKQTMGDDDLK